MNDTGRSNWALALGTITAVAALGSWALPGGIRALRLPRASVYAQEKISPQGLNPLEPHKPKPRPPANQVQTNEPPPELAYSTAWENGGSKNKSLNTWRTLTLTLGNQEQKSVVPGCASLAVEFHDVSGVDFVTVRINVQGESIPYAVSHAGEQFSFSCRGKEYFVSVLLIDREAGTARLSVERIAS